jgi:hypothetical protein
MLGYLLGEAAIPTIQRISMIRQIYREMWPNIRRLWEYYLNDDATHFDITAQQIFNSRYPSTPTPAARDSAAFRASSLILTPLDTADDAGRRILNEFIGFLPSFMDEPSFVRYAKTAVQSGAIALEQQRLWDCVKMYVSSLDSWLPGILADVAANKSEIDLETLRLARDDFSQLRDIYISCFEACCKALVHVVAMINTHVRNDPHAMRTAMPAAISHIDPNSHPVRTLRQFERVTNSRKLAYLDEWPVAGTEFQSVLSNRTRNSIGHNSVRHDLRTGHVVNDSGEALNYIQFVRQVYRLTCPLARVSHYLHTVRITASSH